MSGFGEFTCDECGGTFPKAWSDEEALAEADGLFGAAGPLAVICDDCWREFMPWLVEEHPEAFRRATQK